VSDPLSTMLAKLAKLSDPAHQQTVELAVAAIRWDGVASLVMGAIALSLACTLAYSCFICIARGVKADSDGHERQSMAWFVAFVFAVILGVGCTVVGLAYLASSSSWIAAFDPKAALTLKIMRHQEK
jgi:hypothetical protein